MKPETVKVIVGASIVLIAACIMLQGILGFVFSLAKLGIVILIAVLVSSSLAFAIQNLLKRNVRAEISSGQAADSEED